jgi:hypothetical protein
MYSSPRGPNVSPVGLSSSTRSAGLEPVSAGGEAPIPVALPSPATVSIRPSASTRSNAIVAGVGKVDGPVSASRHPGVPAEAQLRLGRGPAVAREALAPAAGNDSEAAVWQPPQDLVPSRVDDVQHARAGDSEGFRILQRDNQPARRACRRLRSTADAGLAGKATSATTATVQPRTMTAAAARALQRRRWRRRASRISASGSPTARLLLTFGS